MASRVPPSTQLNTAAQARARFVAEAARAMTELGGLVQDRLTALMNEAASSREMQQRRDNWSLYQKTRHQWVDATVSVWQNALVPPMRGVASQQLNDAPELGLELVSNDVVENKILASRLVLAVVEKVSAQLNDLKTRIRFLEDRDELADHDILRPEVLLLLMVEQWAKAGMPADSWAVIADVVQKHLIARLLSAYTACNEFLIGQGVMPVIDFKARVRRSAPSAPTGAKSRAPAASTSPQDEADQAEREPSAYGDLGGRGASGYGAAGPTGRNAGFGAPRPRAGQGGGGATGPQGDGRGRFTGGQPGDDGFDEPPDRPGYSAARTSGAGEPQGQGFFGGRLGWGSADAGAGQASGRRLAPAPDGTQPGRRGPNTDPMYSGAAEETRLMTSTTPLARARSRAQGVLGHLKRLFVGAVGSDFEATAPMQASPALAAAIAVRPQRAGATSSSGTVLEDYSPAGVARVAGNLRAQTADLKKKADSKSEKATIEIVALMFQAILQEERIPPAIRVWFARLQMPVLRLALADADFFGTLNHPARQLIDRMGSCVMGFDASGISGSAMEAEIKRVVQVIEQYPETGKRVYQLVYEEFQKFLAKFLTEHRDTQKVVSVAQQVEQKETLTIQYTIELRNMLKDLPVREEIREFLFKVWAEVLAVAAVRKGLQHAETLAFKKSASDLVWAASAKPNRTDRAKVIQDLPHLLQRLRSGMSLLGLSPSAQDAHIKAVSDTLADAFLSKTQAIPQAQIQAMAERLENLEDFVSEDGMGDLPLDAESIEMMLGIDASRIDVVADGGSKPTPAMLAWAQELQLGSWFTLDHNGLVTQVQFAWRSDRKHLNLFASSDGHSYLIQAGRLAGYLQAGLLLPQEEESLTVRATRDALAKIDANPERLLS